MTLRLLTCLFLLAFFLQPASVHAQNAETISPKEMKLVIDSLGNALNRWYIYPEQAAFMVGQVKKQYKSGAYKNIKTRQELANRLRKDLQAAHHDGHLDINYDAEFAKVIETPVSEDERREGYERFLTDSREHNFFFVRTEVLPGNIGYLRLDGFNEFVEEAKPTLTAALHFVGNCKALIIDLRYNGGGSPAMVLQMQSYFFAEKTRMNDIVDRSSDTVKRWADPAVSDFQLDMPVYILTSHYTFSGAEDFAYGLQQVHRAVIVGDTTGGGAHPTGTFSIGQGFVVDIPTHRSPNIFSKTDWEGTGVWPDVSVSSAEALTKAQTLIFTELLAKTTDERERNELQWAMNSSENKARLTTQLQNNAVKITEETLLRYCGDYTPAVPDGQVPEMTVVLKEGYLYRRYDGVDDIRLVPISATTFVYDDESGRTLDFVTNTNEDVSTMILTRRNGSFTLIRKQ